MNILVVHYEPKSFYGIFKKDCKKNGNILVKPQSRKEKFLSWNYTLRIS